MLFEAQQVSRGPGSPTSCCEVPENSCIGCCTLSYYTPPPPPPPHTHLVIHVHVHCVNELRVLHAHAHTVANTCTYMFMYMYIILFHMHKTYTYSVCIHISTVYLFMCACSCTCVHVRIYVHAYTCVYIHTRFLVSFVLVRTCTQPELLGFQIILLGHSPFCHIHSCTYLNESSETSSPSLFVYHVTK